MLLCTVEPCDVSSILPAGSPPGTVPSYESLLFRAQSPIEPVRLEARRSLIEGVLQLSTREAEGGLISRQLEYANGLAFGSEALRSSPYRNIKNILMITLGARAVANVYFSLGECYRNLGIATRAARTNLQKVLNDYGDSEFAGPAAFRACRDGVRRTRDDPTALPLLSSFCREVEGHRRLRLSARYFEARCLEALKP